MAQGGALMSSSTLCSCLAPQIETFVDLRRLSGTDYHSQTQLLGYFDRFLVEQNIHQPRITREICEGYQQSLSGLAPRSQSNRFCVVRQLCEYLARTDPFSYIPEPLRTPSARRAHRPYIFTHEQVGALLTAAAALPPAGSLRPHTYRTLMGLLYSTGIRIGEAFALNIEHFFPDEGRLYICEGKFRKSRWIVLSASTTQAINQYLDRRMGGKQNATDSPLLLNERHQRLHHPTVRQTFMHLLLECGIIWTRRTGPRIHDLRHTFAVHRLLAWYRNGEDVNARLPTLATYMGHVDISSTQVYLQPTVELMGEVNRRFHNHYLNHLASKGTLS
jgi:site-specific recombinase XerD